MEEALETPTSVNASDNALEQLKALVEMQHAQMQSGIEAKFTGLAELFAEKLAYDQSKQQQIDKLHKELQGYKTDLIAKTNRPLINGIIKLYQDVGKTADNLKSKPPEKLTSELFFNRIDDIQDDVDVLLGQHGVSRYNEPGEAFNPRRQRALKNIETHQEDQHGQVSQRVRPGFEFGSELLQKELVNLFIYKAVVQTEVVNTDDVQADVSPLDEVEVEHIKLQGDEVSEDVLVGLVSEVAELELESLSDDGGKQTMPHNSTEINTEIDTETNNNTTQESEG